MPGLALPARRLIGGALSTLVLLTGCGREASPDTAPDTPDTPEASIERYYDRAAGELFVASWLWDPEGWSEAAEGHLCAVEIENGLEGFEEGEPASPDQIESAYERYGDDLDPEFEYELISLEQDGATATAEVTVIYRDVFLGPDRSKTQQAVHELVEEDGRWLVCGTEWQ